jgi:hypothetical protein
MRTGRCLTSRRDGRIGRVDQVLAGQAPALEAASDLSDLSSFFGSGGFAFLLVRFGLRAFVPEIGRVPTAALELESGSAQKFAKSGFAAIWAIGEQRIAHFL